MIRSDELAVDVGGYEPVVFDSAAERYGYLDTPKCWALQKTVAHFQAEAFGEARGVGEVVGGKQGLRVVVDIVGDRLAAIRYAIKAVPFECYVYVSFHFLVPRGLRF